MPLHLRCCKKSIPHCIETPVGQQSNHWQGNSNDCRTDCLIKCHVSYLKLSGGGLAETLNRESAPAVRCNLWLGITVYGKSS